MLFPTHLLFGLLVFIFTKDYFSGGNQWFFLLLLLAGSILPDIDEAKSQINRSSGAFGWIISFFAKHRGMFHSIFLALGVFIALSYFWINYYAWAFFIGYIGHLLLDAFTRMGIQVFYPLSSFRVRGPLKSGGILEIILVLGLVFVLVKLFFKF